ncbi:MAG: hexameric tyrosine-coordinated heme protein [Amylibacter sp.]
MKTETPEEGYALAIKLSRMVVKMTQPDEAARERMRPEYANDAANLTQVSLVVATNFLDCGAG